MKNYHIILIFLLGFFLMPSKTYACGKESKDLTCKMEVTANGTKKMSCCDGKKASNKKGCKGKCGHSNCVTTSLQYSLVFSEVQFNNNNFAFSEKKQNYLNSNTNLSSGFYSLWLIPKIG